MSVVNKMLKDLDRRQGGDAPVFTQHLSTGGSSGLMKAVIGVGLLVIVALIVAVVLLLPNEEDAKPIAAQSLPITPVTVAVVAPPAQTPPKTVESAPMPVIEPAPPVAIAPSPRTEPPPPVATAPLPRTEPTPPIVVPSVPKPTSAPPKPAAPTPRSELAVSVQAPVIEAPPKALAAPPAPAATASESATSQLSTDTRAARSVPSGPSKIDLKPAIAARSAEGEFKRAVALINQGRQQEARAALNDALQLDAGHQGARQTLAVLLVESGASETAEALLAEGLRLNPQQTNFAILAARLRFQRGDAGGALDLLRQYGSTASNNADYRSFTAALLQRAGRHAEAIDEYRAAVSLSPGAGVWWMGLGISYEANGQSREAADAFRRALATSSLSAELS
ncbi:MAG TPA: tetratricopeptide repeat protein, partial [Burkholderiales bacterium]|nr:tetratricopeptide repeat protein [Burkholderiales bacterium]